MQKVSKMSSMQFDHFGLFYMLADFSLSNYLFVDTFTHFCHFGYIRLCSQNRQPSQEKEAQGNGCTLGDNKAVNTCG